MKTKHAPGPRKVGRRLVPLTVEKVERRLKADLERIEALCNGPHASFYFGRAGGLELALDLLARVPDIPTIRAARRHARAKAVRK